MMPMRNILNLNIIFLLLNFLGYGQQLSFRGDLIREINIKSSNGYYDIDKRRSIGDAEIFNIKYENSKQKYFVFEYSTEVFNQSSEDTTHNQNKIKLKNISKIQLDNLQLDSLIQSLDKSTFPLKFSSMKISKNEFLSLTDKKHIKNVIKRFYKNENFGFRLVEMLDWWFTPKKEKIEIISACQNIENLNDFLKVEFDSSGWSFVSEYWDDITIRLVTNTNEYVFSAQYPNIFRQPWYEMTNKTTSMKNVLNPEINRHLLNILPKNFMGINSLKFESLTTSFILWKLKKKKIILYDL